MLTYFRIKIHVIILKISIYSSKRERKKSKQNKKKKLGLLFVCVDIFESKCFNLNTRLHANEPKDC